MTQKSFLPPDNLFEQEQRAKKDVYIALKKLKEIMFIDDYLYFLEEIYHSQ